MVKKRSSRPYFQFPLCALSYPEPDRLACIISFCCVEHGKRQWSELADQDQEALRRKGIHAEVPSMIRSRKTRIWGYTKFGAEALGVKICNTQLVVREHGRLSKYIEDFEARHGPDALLRVAVDFVVGVGSDSRLSYEDLAVLCAIYSKIGAKTGAVRITREDIWRRAHGFKSKQVFEAEMLGKPFVTERQVRSIIESLHARRFFARVTHARRQT